MIYRADQGRDVYGIPIGIVVMDCLIPYPPGTPGNASTFHHPVLYSVVQGADMEHLIYQGDPALEERFLVAGRDLVRQGVRAIVGNCGFMILFQERLAAELPVPVFMSSLLQLPLVTHSLRPGEKVGILTASADSLGPRHLEIACGGATIETAIMGLEHQPAFRAAVHEQVGTLDFEAVRDEVVAAASDLVARDPRVGAFLFECTDLPPFASAVQAALGLPVFDITTLIAFAHSGVVRKAFPAVQ